MHYPTKLTETLKRVLVIEDDEEHREILMDALTYSNFEVNVLADGKLLFDAIRNFKPDLILLDYILPGENGIMLCKKIKSTPDTSFIPVVLMSAYLGALDNITTCDSILYKPFDLDVLLEMIDRVCLKEHGQYY